MTFIESSDWSPVSQYTQWMLHYIAPLFSPSSTYLWSNIDITSSINSISTVGAVNINGIAYSLTREMTLWFDEYDWFDNTDRKPPYYIYQYAHTQFTVADAVNTRYFNVVSDRYFKEWVTVGASITANFGFELSATYCVASRCRFHASLVDISWNKTAIWTSWWWTVVPWLSKTPLMTLTWSWIEVSWTDKRLLLEVEWEFTHNTSTSSMLPHLYSMWLTHSSAAYYQWVFISCSAV